ncbi:xylulokinase [Abditibacterium utsteinense]|uniref:Xylulose kinase n=1 Tax=Abditibacterium utsteinense TaxID=1960156 RepID=A0A2S8SU27_9BACT|nr:xylulokinase [Abditibacterium utsteinense]PQV64313.1 xylulokinase [Abditibacterium utsteinense]
MAYLLGIDIGTSGTKVIAIDEGGKLVASAGAEYELSTPRPLWAEQNALDWWDATCKCCREIVAEIGADDIAGIGLSGQMHGLVMLDKNHQVLRPAILWCDQRTQKQCDWMTEVVGKDLLVSETANPVLTGFTAPKILWVRDNEPEIYERAVMYLLPKDYVRFRLTGEFATEVSDASGTSLLNVPERKWSEKVCEKIGVDLNHLPRVYESFEISGRISSLGAAATGLKAGTPVVGGGGDQAAGAVGNGIVQSGIISVAMGTSGVVFAFSDTPVIDPQLRVHTFCHAVPNKWHVMGVMLSAGGSLRWYRDTLCRPEVRVAQLMQTDPYELIAREAATAAPGSDGLFFLPYLTGERTPHPDPLARGAFIGLNLLHTKAHMARSVMEGVSYGLRDSLEIFKSMDISIGNVRANGGGAKSEVWRQITADIFGFPLSTIAIDEGPALGVALLAGVGAGIYSGVEEACSAVVKVTRGASVVEENARIYEKNYQVYRALYPALKESFAQIENLNTGI